MASSLSCGCLSLLSSLFLFRFTCPPSPCVWTKRLAGIHAPPPILELSHSLSVRVCVLACRIGGTFFTPFVSLALSLCGVLEAVLSVAWQCVCARKRAWARRLFYSVLSSSLCACVSFVLSYTSLACHLLVVDDVDDPFTSF